ncbi:MAG TPA: hypothetical protein VM243_08455 [Phycisphaerae bacterium]|nr:hypothetical protein [Phycisphaerae bacterium]
MTIVKVTCYDPDARESISFTVYPTFGGARDVVRALHAEARKKWRVTNINDRRHKRRSV